MAEVDSPLHAIQWIEANRATFKPPTGSKVVWRGDDMFVMLLAGPNARDDYHVNASSETFYQLKGDVTVRIIDAQGQREDVVIRAGEVWVCPSGVPHQPHRPSGTYGLVIERMIRGDEPSQLVWYCDGCGALLHRVEMVGPSSAQTRNVLDEITGQEHWRTCQACGRYQVLTTAG